MDSISSMIFNIVLNIATLLIFMRFIMQLAAVDFYNPVVQSTVHATKIVDIFGRILPTIGKGRINLAALVLIILLRLIDVMGNYYIDRVAVPGISPVLIETFLGLISDLLNFCRYMIFGSIILSWVSVFTNARSPFIDVVYQLAEPLLAPFRKILPNTGPLDFSPIVALLAIFICQKLLAEAAMTLMASMV